jgi:hypothetical protein
VSRSPYLRDTWIGGILIALLMAGAAVVLFVWRAY